VKRNPGSLPIPDYAHASSGLPSELAFRKIRSHHEDHEGHEGFGTFVLKLRALRVLRGENDLCFFGCGFAALAPSWCELSLRLKLLHPDPLLQSLFPGLVMFALDGKLRFGLIFL
jgi:hypothetical protein